jgi:hypothetical protein
VLKQATGQSRNGFRSAVFMGGGIAKEVVAHTVFDLPVKRHPGSK